MFSKITLVRRFVLIKIGLLALLAAGGCAKSSYESSTDRSPSYLEPSLDGTNVASIQGISGLYGPNKPVIYSIDGDKLYPLPPMHFWPEVSHGQPPELKERLNRPIALAPGEHCLLLHKAGYLGQLAIRAKPGDSLAIRSYLIDFDPEVAANVLLLLLGQYGSMGGGRATVSPIFVADQNDPEYVAAETLDEDGLKAMHRISSTIFVSSSGTADTVLGNSPGTAGSREQVALKTDVSKEFQDSCPPYWIFYSYDAMKGLDFTEVFRKNPQIKHPPSL